MRLSIKCALSALTEAGLRVVIAFRKGILGSGYAGHEDDLTELALLYRAQGKQEKAEATWSAALSIARGKGKHVPANLGMQQVIHGVHRFQTRVFPRERKRYERLSHGQCPEVLFITCSDSRIDTYHITQMHPGELFVLRNAGNIVPVSGTTASGGEEASIEFAVNGLGVKDIIVCGHSHCGAMRGLLHPQSLADLPAVAAWLSHAAEATRKAVHEKHGLLGDEELLQATVEQNVLVQMQHLRSHPAVAEKIASGQLQLHGWVYKIETGEVLCYDNADSRWRKL